jgi:NAD(P)H-hydrate epimerase
MIPTLPARHPDSHKGDFGRILVIGGARGMTGAISLTGLAALRSGAGLVTLATPQCCQSIVAHFNPTYMTRGLPEDEAGRFAASAWTELTTLLDASTSVACGPGMGRSTAIEHGVSELYGSLKQPLVIDADGLNALAAHRDRLGTHAGPRILTPHLGEFRRLVGQPALTMSAAETLAPQWAADHGVVLVLKSHHTLVTDGHQTEQNQTGNPGIATGGCGDVLTGIVAALSALSLTPWQAARLAVHVHGRAGDLAAAELGQTAMIAPDLIDYLPAAWKELEG